MDDRTVREALQRHWDASDASDFDAEHQIYREDAVLDYPQSGERIRGRRNIQESRTVQPNKKRFTVRRFWSTRRTRVPWRKLSNSVMISAKAANASVKGGCRA